MHTLSNLIKKQLEVIISDNKILFGGKDLRNQLFLSGIDLDVPNEGYKEGYGDLYYKDSAIKYIFSLLNDEQILNYVSKLYINVIFETSSKNKFLNQLNEVLLHDSIQISEGGNINYENINNEEVPIRRNEKSQMSNISHIDEQTDSKDEDKIFIVHGHDEEMKANVARVIEKLGLTPIILHEQPNMGKTIIEKFHDNSQNVSFAIILMSPDDKGCKSDLFPESAKHRARQNVILELGYFIGTLGREKVFVLVKDPEELDIPSDILAVLYTPYKSGWEKELVKEMKACKICVDMNKLV